MTKFGREMLELTMIFEALLPFELDPFLLQDHKSTTEGQCKLARKFFPS